METCVFCKISAGEIPADVLFQDDEVMAFRDINPLAPVHVLVIPRRYIPALSEVTEAVNPLIVRLVWLANRIAKEQGIVETGYRVVINSGADGRQMVPHLHVHVLGGKQLDDKLG